MRTHRIPILGVLVLWLLLTLSPGLAFAGEPKRSSASGLSGGNTATRSTRTPPNPSRIHPHNPDHILVRFKETASRSAINSAHAGLKAVSVKRFKSVRNLHLAKLPKGLSVEDALASYRNNPLVLYAEPDYEVKAYTTPNDPSFGSLWALENTGQSGGTPGADINAVSAWDMTTGSKNVVVAVIDTGVDYTHEDLAENMWRNTADCNNNGIDDDGNGYIDDCYGIGVVDGILTPFDDYGHGTHVSGTIGAAGNNSIGVVGVNWNISIMACKFLNKDGAGYNSGAIECLDYVREMKTRGVNVVATNNSWGGGGFSYALRDAIDAHKQAGILFIAAAGNSAGDNDVYNEFPSGYFLPNLISVSATDNTDTLAFFSNDGKRTVHLGAPGMEIMSTIPGNAYDSWSGTSMAAPHVTGAAALLKAQNPSRDWRTIKNLIFSTGVVTPSLANTITQRRLDVYRALTCDDSTVLARLFPVERAINGTVGFPVDLSVLHINCGTPSGEVQVAVDSGEVITLKDDGTGTDQAAGDGIYSGQWTPTTPGIFILNFPGGDTVPVQVFKDQNPALFKPAKNYMTGIGNAVAVGDVTGDGKNDVIGSYAFAGDPFTFGICVLPQNNSGTLDPPVDYPLSAGFLAIRSIAVGDVNNDGRADVVVGNYSDKDHPDMNFIAVFLQNSSGRLGPEIRYISENSYIVRIADLNNDGLADIASAGYDTDGVEIRFQKSDGSLNDPVLYPVMHGLGLEIGDVNNDGLNDIIVNNSNFFSYPSIGILHQKSDGTFGPAIYQNLRCPDPGWVGCEVHALAIGDINGDGRNDIVATNSWMDRVYVFTQGSSGTINPPVIYPAFWSPMQVKIADVNGDGRNDIIVAQHSGWVGDMNIHIQAPNGTFFPYLDYTAFDQVFGSEGMAVGDVSGDGVLDIVTADVNFGVSVLYGDSKSLGDPTKYTIRIIKEGKGLGTVVSSPPGIDCGSTCEAQFITGTRVRLTAIPAPGSSFSDWSCGFDCQFDSKGNCTVLVTRSAAVWPWFEPTSVTITVAKVGSGTGSIKSDPPGIDCGSRCVADFSGLKRSITLKPVADPDSFFWGWGTGCATTGRDSCQVDLDFSKTVEAAFMPKFYTITVSKSGSGSVTSSPTGINCGSTCKASFEWSRQVTLTATPAPGYTFTRWSGGCNGWSPTCRLFMDANIAVDAVFTPISLTRYNLTATRMKVRGGDGTITASDGTINCGTSCKGLYYANTAVTLTATPGPNSVFTGWGGACSGTGGCTLIMDKAKTVRATFTGPSMLKVMKMSKKKGSGKVVSSVPGIDCGLDCQETYPFKTVVTLSARPDPGSTFTGWTPKSICSGTDDECIVTMDGAKTVRATFVGTYARAEDEEEWDSKEESVNSAEDESG